MFNPFISGNASMPESAQQAPSHLQDCLQGVDTKPGVASFHVISWHERNHPPRELT